MSDQTTNPAMPARRRVNIPLIIGLILVFGIIILAIWGPTWAPNDPREQKLIIQIDGQWFTPPYKAFTPGYVLGSDNLGRDLFSWLLWSIRPTMLLVLIVAALRMAIGVVLGVMAGYSDRWSGKLADGLIAVALSVPALIASILVITAVGFHLGIWAFVLGLVSTGWAETASLVRERTRTIRAQQAVEASVALGATSGQTFFLHIMPQVMPMAWMLLSFEVSSTLVTMAGLGFLGYYLGGAVFQEVDDFVYQRISEMPELGQMLATAWLVLDEPWAMVAAGTVVFIIVLAFNLIGEGLQYRLTRKLGGARSFYLSMAGQFLPWWDDSIRVPLGKLVRKRVFQAGAMLVVVVLFAALLLRNPGIADLSPYAATETPQPTATQIPVVQTDANGGIVNSLQTPGGHFWANANGDPWRSRVVNYTGPTTDTIQWEFETHLGFVSGPAVDSDGVVYIAARDQDESDQDTGLLYALSPDGQEVWRLSLPAKPVGTPAIAGDGTLVVCDKTGVTAFNSDGSDLWRYNFESGKSPTAGAVIAEDNSIYIKAQDGMLSLDAEGALRWHTPLSDTLTALTPHLGADDAVLYWQDLAFDAATGALLGLNGAEQQPSPLSQYIVGADGDLYYRFGELIYGQPSDMGFTNALLFDGSIHTWDGSDAGVLPDGQVWLLARPATGGMGLGFFWSQPGSTEEVVGKLSIPQARNINVLAIDREQAAYVCMDMYNSYSSCIMIDSDEVKAQLRFSFRGVQALAGAALAPGRLYVATRDGTLMAIGDDLDAIADNATPASGDVIQELSTWDIPVNPGGHPWSHENGDPWGTRWAAFDGPHGDAEILWVMENGAGYASAPVVAADGTIYAISTDGRLMAYTADGGFKWATRLMAPGVGSPAIGANGNVYITDESGYLIAFDPEGNQMWKYHASGDVITPIYSQSSGELLREEVFVLDGAAPAGAGPIVAPDGTIYFTLAVEVRTYAGGVSIRNEVMIGVTPSGETVYQDPAFTWSGRQPPRLSANDAWLIVHDHFVMPRSEIAPEGALLSALWDLQDKFYADEENEGRDMFLRVGANGETVRAYRRTLERLTQTTDGIAAEVIYEWDEETSPGTIVDIGVTHDGTYWMFFRNGSFAWITPEGELIGTRRYPFESLLFALDQQNVAYGCGSSMGKAPECMAFAPGVEDPLWLITLQESEKIAGGALAPGVLYVTTEQGRLYALGVPAQ